MRGENGAAGTLARLFKAHCWSQQNGSLRLRGLQRGLTHARPSSRPRRTIQPRTRPAAAGRRPGARIQCGTRVHTARVYAVLDIVPHTVQYPARARMRPRHPRAPRPPPCMPPSAGSLRCRPRRAAAAFALHRHATAESRASERALYTLCHTQWWQRCQCWVLSHQTRRVSPRDGGSRRIDTFSCRYLYSLAARIMRSSCCSDASAAVAQTVPRQHSACSWLRRCARGPASARSRQG